MPKTMLVNVVNEEESRIAILSDGLLEELSIETSSHEQIEGNIYKAKIVKVVHSLDAVFVDYGGRRNGFLAVPDIHPKYLPEGSRGVGGLRSGQELLVQVRKGELGQKGAALTTYVSLPGRYFVLMPFVEKRGVSRKIQDEATRSELRQVLNEAGIPEEMGYIARTAAEGRTKQELTRDAGYLIRLWRRIQSEYESSKAPSLLYQDSDIVIRTIRDYFTPSIQEVWVDDPNVCEQVHSFFRAVMPWYQRRVQLFQEKSPLFSKHDLESQIASIYDKTVALPSGGSIVIEQTEALVSVDVNSGKTFQGKDIEETAFIANKEAAEEIARQLRLRDLGGLVVVDFIDMRSSKHGNEVRKVLHKALKEDKARTDVGTISKFGMLEFSRQRIKSTAAKGVTTPCPVCKGAGKVRSPESSALSILRMVQSELARKGSASSVLVGAPLPVAALLLNRKRRQISELETDFGARVLVFSEPALQPNQYYIEYRGAGDPKIDTNLPEDFPRAMLQTPKGLPESAPRPARPMAYALIEEEEPREVPLEPPDEIGPHAELTPAKKKRRRRRKKKSENGAPESSEAAAAGPPEPARPRIPAFDAAPAPAPEAASPAPAQTQGGAQIPEQPSPSSKRRSRRRRRKKRTETAGPTAEGSGLATPAPGAGAPGGPPTPPEAAREAGPAGQLPHQAAEETPASAAGEPKKPARRSRRRAPKAQEIAAAPETPPQESANDAPPAAKRSRRARRPSHSRNPSQGGEEPGSTAPGGEGKPPED